MDVAYGTQNFDAEGAAAAGSGAAGAGSTTAPRHPVPGGRLPRAFLFDPDPATGRPAPVEATGLAVNSLARGAVAMSTIFLGPALLGLAKEAAASASGGDGGGDGERGEDGDDVGRIYGMRPTSLLTNIGVFGGILSCALTPLFGSVVDHTTHRKDVGIWSAAALSVVKGIEVFVGKTTWFAVSSLQVTNMVLWNAYQCSIFAYTAELSTSPDAQTGYNARFQTIYYVSMLAFLASVMTTSALLGVGDLGTARVSQSLAFVICASVFSYSWAQFFRPRPALRDVPPGSTLLKSGFQELSSTIGRIWRSWQTLRYFLLSVSLSESATAALSTISTTYMTHVLEMSAAQIGKVFLCVFVAGIPGSKLGGWIGVKLNPLRSALLCLAVLVVNTSLASYMLTGPEHQAEMYGFAAIWGVCLSWIHPTHAALYCTIIPRGRETELMGIYIFAGSVLSWLPPLVFTCLNEAGVSMAVGLASLNVFFVGGFVLFMWIGDFDTASAISRGAEDSTWIPIDESGSRLGISGEYEGKEHGANGLTGVMA